MIYDISYMIYPIFDSASVGVNLLDSVDVHFSLLCFILGSLSSGLLSTMRFL